MCQTKASFGWIQRCECANPSIYHNGIVKHSYTGFESDTRVNILGHPIQPGLNWRGQRNRLTLVNIFKWFLGSFVLSVIRWCFSLSSFCMVVIKKLKLIFGRIINPGLFTSLLLRSVCWVWYRWKEIGWHWIVLQIMERMMRSL